MLKGCRVHAKISCLLRRFYNKWHCVFPPQHNLQPYSTFIYYVSVQLQWQLKWGRKWLQEHRKNPIRLREWNGERYFKVQVVMWLIEHLKCLPLVILITLWKQSLMLLWATWFTGIFMPSVAAQEPALHSGCSSPLSWLKATTARHLPPQK